MKTIKKLSVICGIIFLITLASCVKNEYYLQNTKTPGWDPNIASPLINSRLTIWDILNDYDSTDVVVEDPTFFLYLVYTGRVYSETAEDLIQIGDQAMNTSHTFNTSGTIAQGDSFVTTFSYAYPFSFQGSQVIDSVYFKGGNINVSINTNFNMPGKIEMQFPGTKNGQPFTEIIPMAGPNVSHNISLNNSKLNFSQTVASNSLNLNFKVVLYGTGNQDNSPYNVSVNNTFNNLQFKALFGYLGQLNFSLNQDTVAVKLYENNVDGIINWEDPRLYLTITNYLGMPVELSFNLLEAVRTKAPQNSQQISGPGIPNPWNILYPNFAQTGQGIQTQMLLDKNNSNIADAFNISPQRIYALLNAVSNPSGFAQNFAYDTSRFIIDAKVELPMHGTANNYVVVDTTDLDIGSDFENAENIDWVLFKIYCENGFPVDAKLQIYFTDENDMLVDSLLMPPQQFVYAATPGPPPDYIVTNTTTKVITTTVNNDRIMEYHRIKKAIIRAEMNTYDNASQIVKLYSFYEMHVMLGAQIQLKF
jgi:hypothetical protein